ncbi:MAG: mechanosensitive ion channel domain-containing protein [Bacteroidota bacterium]
MINYIATSLQKKLGNWGYPVSIANYKIVLFAITTLLIGITSYLLVTYFFSLLSKKYDSIRKVERIKRRITFLVTLIYFFQGVSMLPLSVVSGLLSQIIWLLHFVAFSLMILIANQLVDIIFGVLNDQSQQEYGNQSGILSILKSIAKISTFSLIIILGPRFFVIYDLSRWLSSFTIGAGTLTAIAALASKDLISNFFGALVIMIGKPFKVGDWIIINKLAGRVVKIDIRSTELRTALGTSIHIPNGMFASKDLENYGHVSSSPIQITIALITITEQTLATFLKDIQDVIKQYKFLVHKHSHIYMTHVTSKNAKINFHLAFQATKTVDIIKHTQYFLHELQRIAKERKVVIE